MRAFLALLRRDLVIGLREGSALGTALGFYLIVVAILPIGLGPDLKLLARIAPGVLWIALLLSALLSLGRMLETDHEDGTLEVLALGPLPLEALIAAKSLAHWITTGVPLTLLSPLLGLLLNLDIVLHPALLASLLLGTPAASFLGGIGAALTLQSRRAGLLVALLALPLYVPTLIFGVASVSPVSGAAGATAAFLVLGAISLTVVLLAPFAGAAAVRMQLH